jgi:hypothetical protein
LLRSAEIKPLFYRFVRFRSDISPHPFFCPNTQTALGGTLILWCVSVGVLVLPPLLTNNNNTALWTKSTALPGLSGVELGGGGAAVAEVCSTFSVWQPAPTRLIMGPIVVKAHQLSASDAADNPESRLTYSPWRSPGAGPVWHRVAPGGFKLQQLQRPAPGGLAPGGAGSQFFQSGSQHQLYGAYCQRRTRSPPQSCLACGPWRPPGAGRNLVATRVWSPAPGGFKG